jgi:prepilin-type N-terminal cleavage/methylation domain-containing protein
MRGGGLQAGFSLLEMVVVLAIIGILVAIQLPNVIGNTDKAKFVAAQTQISNAVTECATAKTSGATETELTFRSPKFLDNVPSMVSDPTGYRWVSGNTMGCGYMLLQPVDSEGADSNNQGWPRLYAKLAAGGRIVKAADMCKPFGTLDFTKECKRWDPSLDMQTYRTGRNLRDPNWALQQQASDGGVAPAP